MKIQALLLPARLRQRPSAAFRALRIALIVLPFVAFAWIAVRFVNTSRNEQALEARLTPLREARTRSIGDIKKLIVPPAEIARVEASVGALNATTAAGAASVLGVLPALERELPDGAGLEVLTAKPAGAAVRVSLKGIASNEGALAQVADRVSRLSGIILGGWNRRPTGELEWTAEGDLAKVPR